MADDGVGAGAAAAGMNEGPAKRTRRPSVRLHEPYYENLLGHRKQQRRWKPIKRHSDGAKNPPTVKAKTNDVSDASKGENTHYLSSDDVVIGNRKILNDSNRNKDFKRKRVRPSASNKRCTPAKSRQNEDKEIQEFSSSISGGKQEEKEEEYDDDGFNSNLVVENTDPSCPNSLFSNNDGDDKSSDDNNNVDRNQGMEQKGLHDSLEPNKSEGDVSTRGVDKKNKHGVRAWLKKLGLDKYAPVFEVHEVDDEVLEKLTLDDLKDMGINAVGSRRKMYASIQKLGLSRRDDKQKLSSRLPYSTE